MQSRRRSAAVITGIGIAAAGAGVMALEAVARQRVNSGCRGPRSATQPRSAQQRAQVGEEPVEQAGEQVQVLGRVSGGPADGRIVAVRQGSVVATSFHPELTGDTRLHRLFVELVRAAA